MKQREALEMARAALESERVMGKDTQGNYTVEVTPVRILEAIKAIDEALAEQQGEPVAWPCEIEEADFSKGIVTIKMNCGDYKVSAGTHFLSKAPRYTHPTPEAPAPSQPLASYGASRDRVGGAGVYPASHQDDGFDNPAKRVKRATKKDAAISKSIEDLPRWDETCDCGCNDPAFKTPWEAVTFLAQRFKHAGVGEAVARSYARDLDKIIATAPSQQAAQTALAWMRPSIYAECQPETTTLREVADEWIAEGHVVTALGPLSQAAPWQELSRDETQRALMECERNAASDEYFKTRPQIDTTDRRRVFAAAFDRAWKARLPTVRDSTTETLAALHPKNGGAA